MSDEATGFTTMEKIIHLVDVSGDIEMVQAQYFDNTSSPITTGQGSFASVSTIGGNGNSSLFNVRNTTSRITYGNVPASGMSTSGTPIQMLGSSYAVSALPVADVSSATFIVSQSAAPAFTSAAMAKANASGYLGPAADGFDYLSPTTGVTGVFGTAGQVTVTPSHPNPTISLPNVGPGAGTYGGNGLAGVQLDNQGRVAAVTAKTFLPDPGSNGFISRFTIPPNSTVARTFTSTGGSLTVTNGDGVAGNPNLDISSHGVTYGDIQTVGAGALLGNPTGSPTTASEITLGAGLAFSGSTLINTGVGTTYTATSPIVVTGSVISCPTCGTSSGSVTGVFGSSGRIVVSPSSPNPTVDLAFAGLGAGAYGGTGIAGLNLDDYGRVINLSTASYLTSTGTTPGTYNNLTVAGSGLITGASITKLDDGGRHHEERGNDGASGGGYRGVRLSGSCRLADLE